MNLLFTAINLDLGKGRQKLSPQLWVTDSRSVSDKIASAKASCGLDLTPSLP